MNSKKTKDHVKQSVQQVVNAGGFAKDDPEGSYTGIPAIPNEMPQQDADDL